MIENIRRYTGLLIVFFALVVVALVVGIKDDIFRGGPSGQPVIKIAGRTYTDKEFHNFGSSSLELANFLARSGDFGLYSFVMGLTGNAMTQEEAVENFFISRMILRQAKDEFGVHPGNQEITDYIRSMRAFAGPDGQFEEEAFRTLIERGIGRLGLTETDLRELVADSLAANRINAIVGAGLGVSRDIATTQVALRDQRVSGHIARFDIDPFEAEIEPTEDEIRSYWETIQDAFVTDPLRRFTYIIATPDMPEDPEEEAEPEDGDVSEDDTAVDQQEEAAEDQQENAANDEQEEAANDEQENAANDEQEEAANDEQEEAADDEEKEAAEREKQAEEKEAAEREEAEKRAKKDAELAELRRQRQLELDTRVDDFTFQLEERQGAGFEELAAEYGWEVKTTDFFSRGNPPEELDLELRTASFGGKAVDELFRIEPTTDPVSRLSQPIAIGENQWLVARLDEEKPTRPQTFEEARDEARDKFINEKAVAAMQAAADEAAAKIKEGLAAGKSFAEAAAEAGIPETREFTGIGMDYRPVSDEPGNLFQATRFVDPGGMAEVIMEADRAFIVHVTSREVEKDPDVALRVDGEIANQARGNEMIAYLGWLGDRIESARVERLYRR